MHVLYYIMYMLRNLGRVAPSDLRLSSEAIRRYTSLSPNKQISFLSSLGYCALGSEPICSQTQRQVLGSQLLPVQFTRPAEPDGLTRTGSGADGSCPSLGVGLDPPLM